VLPPIEIVTQALNHRPVPFVPRGELFFNKNFLDHFFSRHQGHYLKQLKEAAERLRLSVVGVELDGENARSLLKEGGCRDLEPFFTVGCLNGPMSGLIASRGFIKAMAATVKNPETLSEISRGLLSELKKMARSARINGFQAMAITDDIAGNKGLYFSPDYFRDTLWPVYKTMAEIIKGQGMFVFFHSDGDIRKIIDLLIQAGVDCIHPVDTQAGLDLYRLKEEFGRRVCFMGHMDPITWSGERVRREIGLAEREFKNGGLIMGSTCGLSMETYNEKFEILYPCSGARP
jgi:hypothetical protein